MEKLWPRFGSGGLAMCFYRGKRVKDSSGNPDRGRRGASSELKRIACQDAMIKYHIRSPNIA
jgi:hypothetical protein